MIIIIAIIYVKHWYNTKHATCVLRFRFQDINFEFPNLPRRILIFEKEDSFYKMRISTVRCSLHFVPDGTR